MHLIINAGKGTYKGAADKILSYKDKKIMVIFFNAPLSEKEVILEVLKKVSSFAEEHIAHFRKPVPVFLTEYRLEYIVVGDDLTLGVFQKQLEATLKSEKKHDRLELPYQLWTLVPFQEYFIPIPEASAC